MSPDVSSMAPADSPRSDLPAPVSGQGTRPAEYPWRTPVAPRGRTRTTGRVDGLRAGIVTRSLANTVDVIVVVLILIGGYAVVAAAIFLLSPKTFHFPQPGFALVLIVALVVQGIYFAISWIAGGRTIGDQILGVRVVSASGRRLGWWLAVARAYLCVVVPIGLLWVAVSPRNRSLQDVLLRTSVVYDWRHEPISG